MTMRQLAGAILLAAACAAPSALHAQQQPAKPAPKKPAAGQPIEIRGQAPTPQVVTVRPREVPQYAPAALPAAVLAAGAWPTVSAGYTIAPSNQLAGRLPLDTSAAGLARGGGVGIVAGTGAAGGAQTLSSNAVPGAPSAASAAEIEAMRKELAMRRARLDSLEQALHGNEAMAARLGVRPAGPRGNRMSAADSAARANEIEAIRRELMFRRIRLDSLQREVNTLGRPRPSAGADTTTVNGGEPPQ